MTTQTEFPVGPYAAIASRMRERGAGTCGSPWERSRRNTATRPGRQGEYTQVSGVLGRTGRENRPACCAPNLLAHCAEHRTAAPRVNAQSKQRSESTRCEWMELERAELFRVVQVVAGAMFEPRKFLPPIHVRSARRSIALLGDN